MKDRCKDDRFCDRIVQHFATPLPYGNKGYGTSFICGISKQSKHYK